jgi:sulfur carrier protein
MTILVNGRAQPLPQPQTLADLLLILNPARPFAVARNEEFIPREDYGECRISPGDRIDIVHPTAGG